MSSGIPSTAAERRPLIGAAKESKWSKFSQIAEKAFLEAKKAILEAVSSIENKGEYEEIKDLDAKPKKSGEFYYSSKYRRLIKKK